MDLRHLFNWNLSMIHVVYAYLFLFYISEIRATLLVKITPRPSATVNVGGQVELKCNFNGTFDRDYAVTWKHGSRIVGEECHAYEKRYSIKCSPGDYTTALNFDYLIKKVEWSDRGSWTCAYKFNDSTINLNVQKPAELTDLQPLQRTSGQPLEGTGKRVNPFNLMSGPTTQFQCSTGCGYPAATIKWKFSNKTTSGYLNTFSSMSNAVGSCQSVDTKGMLTVASTLTITNCSQMGLHGHLKISCIANGPHYPQPVEKFFYIACPASTTAQPYGGLEALVLTHGEIIGIAVGCALAFILTFLAIVWFNRKRLKAHDHASI